MYINWLNRKDVDYSLVKTLLNESKERNHYTNYGPLVHRFEEYLHDLLKISNDKVCILASNGTTALHSIGYGLNRDLSKKLKWATQSYTFPSSVQGPFQGSKIIDIDDNSSLDLDKIPKAIDGIVVTNLFGTVVDIDKYENWATVNKKILLFDSATVPYTFYKGKNSLNYGTASFVSLHHTKPLGFGEGGLIVVDKKYEESIRKALNFGFDNGKWNENGGNLRMSDISAAFIFQHIERNFEKYTEHHKKIYKYFLEIIEEKGLKTLPNYGDDSFINCLTLVFDKPVNIPMFCSAEIKKYYIPLKSMKKSNSLYKRILCIPCHLEMSKKDLKRIISEIENNI